MKKSLSIYLTVGSGIKFETISSTCNINGADEIQYIINLHKDHPNIKQIKNMVIPDSNQKQVVFSFLFLLRLPLKSSKWYLTF